MDDAELTRLRERLRVLEAQVAHLYEHLGVDPGPFAAPPPADQLDPEVVQLLTSGKKINAIKLHREKTGLGLKEALDAIEGYERRYSLG
jgi:large subunit ribosomal protein L7/L12